TVVGAASTTVVTSPPPRTAPATSRAGNPVPAAGRPAVPPAGPARHGGPVAGGSLPPCGASGRSASWSAGHGPGQAGRRSAEAADPPPSGRPPYGAAHARWLSFRPPARPARTSGAPRDRSAAWTADA